MESGQLVGQGAGRSGKWPVVAVGEGHGAAQPGAGEGDGDQAAVGGHGDGRHDGRSQPGRHEGQDAVHLAALADQVRGDPGITAGVEGDRAEVVALPEHDERQPVQVGHPHPAPRRQGVLGSDGQDEGVVEEGCGGHQRVGHRLDDQGEVDLTAGQLGHQLVGSGLDHEEVDPGMAGLEIDQGRGQDPGDEAGRGADGEPSPGHAREGPGFRSRGRHVGQDAADERQQGLAVRRQGHQALARPAIEQLDAELALEKADLTAERGLGQVEAGRRPGEVLLLGHRHRDRQLVQLHWFTWVTWVTWSPGSSVPPVHRSDVIARIQRSESHRSSIS